jgi:2-succinyl-5-enolpyruvyl-6-hydroxy-3-cyclohexene-1-carboxylate synthase
MSNLAQGWARLIVRALADAGVRRWVVSPGSRSTPLALAIASHPDLIVVPVIDERSAAFTALGMTRATGEPAAVLCTSGTAAAHFFPAIIEASEAGLPLLAVTADRPWEAHGCGSPQTIDQTRLFGDHVRDSLALGEPDASADALRAAARIAVQAVNRLRFPVAGPVHLDVPFRKPLEPVAVTTPEAWEAIAASTVIPRAHVARMASDDAALASLARAMGRSRRGVIIAGPHPGAPLTREDAAAVAALSAASGLPVFADATSGLRFASGERCIGAFDAFLRDPAIAAALRPDFVLQLGWAPLSPALGSWLQAARCPVFAISGHGWSDPFGVVTDVIAGDTASAVRALRVERREPVDAEWTRALAAAESLAWDAVAAAVERVPFGEAAAVRTTVAAIPEGGWLFTGNSRPVRDLDSFVAPSSRALTVLHQRGAAGIDGLVAGAAGASLASAAPGLLLLGDVSLSHDIGSLAVARDVRSPLAIVAIDNGGGRIFDELPIASSAELAPVRDRLFRTAPRIDFVAVAGAYGIPAVRAENTASLRSALAQAFAREGATLVVAAVADPPGATPRETLHRAVRGGAT